MFVVGVAGAVPIAVVSVPVDIGSQSNDDDVSPSPELLLVELDANIGFDINDRFARVLNRDDRRRKLVPLPNIFLALSCNVQ
jgi:hypothetical protein